jgi:predicted lipoprotein with Yx(FWY)xxD motif
LCSATIKGNQQVRKFTITTTSLILSLVLLSACGSSGGKSTSESSSPPSGSGGATASTVKTASNATLGHTVLVDATGMTLYSLSAERNGKFICATSACEAIWHPLISSGGAPAGVESLGTVRRPNGQQQVTYKGMPLYTFAQDAKAGDAKGQGVKDVGTWSAVVTSGSASAAPAKTSSTQSSGGGGGYGY